MKKHITLIRNLAAAFLLLQSAGILHATDIPVKTGYTITRDKKNDAGVTVKESCCSIALSVEKVQYNLTVPANTYSGYTAAYEDNSGNWMILQPKDKTTEWNPVTDATKKGKLAKLFTPVQNQNMEIATTDGTTAELTSAGYIEQSERPVLPAEISGTADNGINLPTLSGGRFYLAEYGTGTTYLLTFKTSGSFMDLEAEAISKERLTKKQISDNMFAWLEATDKSGCKYPALSEKLAEMLAESLIKKDAFDDLYKASGSEYIQLYLKHVYNNSRSIYADGLHEDEPLYNPKAYESIKDTEGESLAEEAKKYLTNGVERGDGKKQNMIYKNSADKEYPSDDSTMNGNPLPYSTDGIDTPETFWYKMKTQAEKNKWKSTSQPYFFGWRKYDKSLYMPGDINGGTVAGCGTDSWGLLTGCIKGAGLAESISYAKKGEIKQPAKNLADYAVKIHSNAAAEYGAGSEKNSKAFAAMQYDYQGLKETSMIVPSLSEVQPGDILYGKKKAGEDETDDGKELIGIITEKGTDSTNPDVFMETTKVVWMDRKAGCAVSTSWKTFSDAVGDLRCLRLLKIKETSEKYEHAESWDVFDRAPASAELEIGSMKEESQVSSERWRWIPNTGEYLVLDKLNIQLKNRSGMKLQPLTGSSYNVTLSGVYDRNYDSTKAAEGNIYNNKAVSYDIVFLDESDTVQCSGKLDKPEVKDGKRLYKFEKTGGDLPVMYADEVGNILYTKSKKRVRLGIRPESAVSAYPGDDLIPAFQAVYTSLSEGSIKYFDFQAKDSDYIAVYDKKLLWRANLYIEQKESALGNIDWNDAHPWNVPPAAGVAQEGTCPKSWSDTWGCNEWNRKMTPDPQFTETTTVGLSNLPAGNGGQVVTFPEFTPLRTLPSGQIPGINNILSKTVAYSYPQHDYEPIQNPAGPEENDPDHRQDGDSGSQDSPFDFTWKMIQQQAMMAAAYDSQGKNKTNTSTTSWAGTSAPDKTWKKYKRGNITTPSYIPSLGLWYWQPGNGNNESGVSALFLSQTYIYEAGTDCIGMAQRAASWMMKPGEYNSYVWHNLLPGMMEYGDTRQGTTSPIVVYTAAAAGKRQYPITEGESGTSDVIVNNEDKSADQNSAAYVAKLRKLIPGDIFVKRRANTSSYSAHIAVVAYVPAKADELTGDELMNQIILVEAEFNNKIQSVIKVLSIGDYNNNNVTASKQIYDNFVLTPATLSGNKLNCQSWAVRRLKCKE
jgi:hypothetical protein